VLFQVAFKMFLGVSAEVTSWSDDSKQCSLILAAHDNPFAEFVELPPQYKDLVYCQLLCGVLRGALEMVRSALLDLMLLNVLIRLSMVIFRSGSTEDRVRVRSRRAARRRCLRNPHASQGDHAGQLPGRRRMTCVCKLCWLYIQKEAILAVSVPTRQHQVQR
jgi:hypothetical protein